MTFLPPDLYDHLLIIAIMVIIFGAAFYWLWRQSEAIETTGLQRLALTYAIIEYVREVHDEASLDSYYRMADLFDLRDAVKPEEHVRAIFHDEDPMHLYHPDIQAIWPANSAAFR